jgi:putative transposase
LTFFGALFYVLARGIERRRIFSDDADDQEFFLKLELALEKSRSRCYVWALLPN